MEQKIKKETSLDEILTECKNGNEHYQEKLYKHFYGYALSISRLFSYSKDDAVSIINDSFLKTFNALQKNGFKDNADFKIWLRQILINTAIDNYRKQIKYTYHLEIEEVEPIESSMNAIEHLCAEDIINLLDQLPQQHRLVFNLYEIQGFKHREIADKLGIRPSTSRTFLTRAKKKLKVLIHKNF